MPGHVSRWPGRARYSVSVHRTVTCSPAHWSSGQISMTTRCQAVSAVMARLPFRALSVSGMKAGGFSICVCVCIPCNMPNASLQTLTHECENCLTFYFLYFCLSREFWNCCSCVYDVCLLKFASLIQAHSLLSLGRSLTSNRGLQRRVD